MTTRLVSPTFLRCPLRAMAGALALLVATPVTSDCARWTIDELMGAMQEIRSDHASFTERKSIAMLEEPVDSSGELFYTAPDRVEKRTLEPKPESMILDGDTLVFERGGKKRRFQMQDSPELAAFIASIRGILAGDRAALEQNYALSLEGSAEEWTLQLLPRDAKIHAVVKSIRISGVGNSVRSIETLQADGDSSLMLIERLATP